MRVLAIGGTGFIGRFAVPMLQELGHEVTVFHRGKEPVPGTRSILGDRREFAKHASELQAIHPDIVIDFLISNQRQAGELIARFPAVRIVMISSCDVYRSAGILHGTEPGEPDNTLVTEDSALRTKLHPYPPAVLESVRAVYPWVEEDYDKIPGERVVLAAGGTVLRLAMIYGPGDPLHRWFPILKRIGDGRQIILLDEATAQWRGIRGYVEDVAWAVVLAAIDTRAAGRVYNVGDAENFTEFEWRRQIAEAAGWKGRFVVLPDDRIPAHLKPRGDLRQHWAAATSRIRGELGYRERTPRMEAFRRTIEWELAHPPAQWNSAEYDYAAEDAAVKPADRAASSASGHQPE
jgi:nucleoside-diphosphate-sugar epimerase